MDQGLIEIIERYNNQNLTLGTLDCLTMLLECIGRDDLLELIRGRYKTLRGALRRLPELTGISSLEELLSDLKTVELCYAQDGDLLVKDNHTFIYFSGNLFGVWDGMFTLRTCNLPLNITGACLYRK